jgi:hypothetical protein
MSFHRNDVAPENRGFLSFLPLAGASLFCLLTCVAAARAQSDAAAPWQLPPGERRNLDPGYEPARPLGVQQPQTSPEGAAAPTSTAPGKKDCGCGGGGAGGSGSCGDGQEGCGLGDCSDDACFQAFTGPIWARGEYLMWWGKSTSVPPLASDGILGRGGNVLIGGDGISQGLQSGARLTLGWWMSPCEDDGVEIAYLFLGSGNANFHQSSEGAVGSHLLARPYFDAETFAEDASVLASPSIQAGWINVRSESEMQSLEVIFRQSMFRECDRSVDLLYGYRYGRLAEKLGVDSSTRMLSADNPFGVPINTVINSSDLFDTKNNFNGGEFGIAARTRYCRWSLELLAKLALGNVQSRVNVNGSTTVAIPGQTASAFRGGFLALPTNMGVQSENNLCVMPELGFTIGYDISCRWKATCGYTFLYWSKVVRPGDQIDRDLNLTQQNGHTLVGFPAPEPKFITNDYWAQGFNFGLEYRF